MPYYETWEQYDRARSERLYEEHRRLAEEERQRTLDEARRYLATRRVEPRMYSHYDEYTLVPPFPTIGDVLDAMFDKIVKEPKTVRKKSGFAKFVNRIESK